MKITIRIILLLILSVSLFSEITTDLRKEGENWIIEFSNKSREDFEAMLFSSDPSYRSEAGQINISAGEMLEILILRDVKYEGDDDPVYIRVISSHSENPEIITLSENREDSPVASEDPLGSDGPVLEYYYTPDCTRCQDFLNKELPEIQEELGIAITMKRFDVTTGRGLKAMTNRLAEMKSTENKLPLIIGGQTILAGDREIEEGLRDLIIYLEESDLVLDDSVGEKGEIFIPGLLPILAAGLLDGINPCAFTTLIFLISWLGLAGRGRREILLTGVLFTAAVFVTYYSVGLGAFAAVRSGSSVQWIGELIRYIMAAVLIVLAIIHIIDYGKIRKGRASDITLQLSKERKKKIHSLIREKTRKAGLFTGSVILGVGVTIYELGCTGQVYLPTLMYMVRAERQISAFALLALYNLAFVVPLIIVFAAAWKGTGSERLIQWFEGNVGKVKMLSALFFITMAVLLFFV